MQEQLPMYINFFGDPAKVVAKGHDLVAYQHSHFTGKFEYIGSVSRYIPTGGGVDVDEISREKFIEQTELERSRVLSGDGPQFAIYETIKGIRKDAREEGRLLTEDERALIASLYRQTYAMWAAEWGEEGDPPDHPPADTDE